MVANPSTHIIDEHGREITDEGEIMPDAFQILDIYDDEGEQRPPRPSWIATISAGFKNKEGYPEASRDGKIHVSGDLDGCKGLIAALEKTEGKRLTIAFLSDDLNDFIFQRITRRSAGALEVYGDRYGLTEIKLVGYEPEFYANGSPKIDKQSGKQVERPIYEHITYAPASKEYKTLKKTCKTEVSVLFALAEWDGTRTAVTFPDSLGAYRIRFTSRNSIQAIVGKLEEIKTRITRGRIAGVPFDLSIAYREVPGPTGKTRNVPVWSLEFRPPEAIRLTSGNLAKLLGGAISEGQRLQVMLPAPKYDLSDAMAEEPDVDLEGEDLTKFQMPSTSEAIDALTNGDPPCDVPYYRNAWHSSVKADPVLSTDDGRHEFVRRFTESIYADQPEKQTASLEAFLANASESQASKLIAGMGGFMIAQQRARGSLQPVASGASYSSTTNAGAKEEAPAEPSLPETTIEHVGPEHLGEIAPNAAIADVAPPADTASGPPPAPPTPAPKSKTRKLAEENYEQLMTAAGNWPEIDLAAFECNASISDDDLGALVNKLAAAVHVAATGKEPVRR